VLNVSGSFSLGGPGGIIDTNASHVFVNYIGTSALQTHVGNTIDGYLFIPNANATLDGTFFGGLYAGTGTITLRSGAKMGSAMPQPATISLIPIGAVITASILTRRPHCAV
jgi:hypothetical protein